MNEFSDLKFSGSKEWSEASIALFHGCIIDDGMGNDNLNLLVIPMNLVKCCANIKGCNGHHSL